MKSKWKEIRADFFNEVEEKYHVDAWKTANDNEGGEVIALIDIFGNVEYINEAAKTDPYAQEVIKEVVGQRLCNFDMGDYLILPLTAEEKLEMIAFFYSNYYDTDQNVEVFAKEFFYLVPEIYNGKLPYRLEFLSDYKEELAERFPKYRTPILHSIDAATENSENTKLQKAKSRYLLYGISLIENDATMKDFAVSLINGLPDDHIKTLPEEEYHEQFMELVKECLEDDISRTDIDYEDLMEKYRHEIGDLLYEMENHGYPLYAYPIHFFGEEAKKSFNDLMEAYISLNFKSLSRK